MANRQPPTIGDEQAAQLAAAIRQMTNAPLDGARDLPVLMGLHPSLKAIFTLPQDNVILQAIGHLVDSARVYAHGTDAVIEADTFNGNGRTLLRLRADRKIETGAECILANVFTCAGGETLFPPPRWFVGNLLLSDLLLSRLPRIRMYASRPVFDSNFHLCSPGWHADSGILIHGPAVEPVVPDNANPDMPALERLPYHLRTLLAGFCFKADADVANALAMFLTGLLANHFIDSSKGVFLVDGNQPGLGKSWLVRCLGLVLDGIDPRHITFTTDEDEVQKRICAILRGAWQSMVFVDNAKAAGGSVISSPTIEANSMAPVVCLRILGKSENYSRPNDLLWVLTMNDTRVSPDLVSRGVPIRLAYEGMTEDRKFFGPDPIRYAREYRLEILGELAGMVVKWNQKGRPTGRRSHRCHEWAGTIGGILEVAGFPEFLENAAEAAASFNANLDALAALAEAVVKYDGPFVELPSFSQE